MGAARTCVLFNPAAGTRTGSARRGGPDPRGAGESTRDEDADRPDDLGPAVIGREGLGRWIEISTPGEGGRLARRLIEDGVERIIVAGGDGTVREVADGVLRSGRPVTLGILPLGTGNDFARTLGIPLDTTAAIEVLERAERTRRLDAISLTSGAGTMYGVNVASGGFGGEVTHGSDPGGLPGFVSYLAGAVSALPELRARRVVFTWEDGSEEEVEALALVVANGRTAAGGARVAPHANPEDGLLDVIVIADAPPAQLARVGARLMAGDYTTTEPVRQRTTRLIRISSDPPMPFSLDGEQIENGGILDLQVLPGALAWIVGPDYRASPNH